MNNRNVKLGYILIGLNNAFFWYAPWLLFLYQFIDIKQATILQMIGLVVRVVSEVPTGAMADLVGKKKTLTIAFLLTAIGETVMAFSIEFNYFVLSYVIIHLGYSFYSGTIDAFIYDSLVEKNEEKHYPKVLGRSNAYLNISTALATIIGGYLFKFWGGLPFLITGMTKLVGVVVTLFLIEPKVDTYLFSFTNFVNQTKKGFVQLFSKNIAKYTLLILLMGSFSTIAYEILDDVAVVDWGYTATGISILYTLIIIVSIPSSLLYERISKRIKPYNLVIIGILILTLNYLFSPLINATIWTSLFLVRVIYSPIKKAAITDIINRNTDSKIRATTLSTYELLIKLPFVVLGVSVGTAMQIHGVKWFSATYATVLLLFLAIYLSVSKIKKIET